MKPLAAPSSNIDDPDEVLAQTVASDAGWQIDSRGHVYDDRGVFVTDSLSTAATVMRELGWFTPPGSMASGVVWRKVPATDARADAVRSASRKR